MIKEGKIVPAEVTIKLLQKAILESDNDKFLIDGFPRNEENRAAFESIVSLYITMHFPLLINLHRDLMVDNFKLYEWRSPTISLPMALTLSLFGVFYRQE